MAVRTTMVDLIALTRLMIFDPAGASQQFSDQQVQDALDRARDDIRYEQLVMAPSIVNTTSTQNVAQTIFADFFSRYGYWEADIVLQGYLSGAYWKVLTPVSMELVIDEAHIVFEASVFTSGTVPGQLPPVFATGKVYDVYSAAAALLRFWAATLSSAYDFSSDSQSFKRSQLLSMKLALAKEYSRQAKPRRAKMIRSDINSPMQNDHIRLLDEDNAMKGAY